MKKQYCVIELQIDLFDPDLLPAMLFREGCNGIEEKSGGVWHIFFKEAINSEKLKGIYDALHPLNSAFDPSMMRLSVRQEEDWLSEWKKNFVPLRIDGKIWITPPWEKPASKPGEIELIIDPRMAFGTGHHATTQLMIQMMHRYVKNGDRVLDAGCGSGILAILAEKLGARNVFGFDIETEAIENARHNSEINKCSKIRFELGDIGIVPSGDYDVILANINRSVLVEILNELNLKLVSEGLMVLSGLLWEEKEPILRALPRGYSFMEEQRLEEWVSLVLKK